MFRRRPYKRIAMLPAAPVITVVVIIVAVTVFVWGFWS